MCVKGGARFSLSKRAVDVDWDAGRASHLPVPHHGRARRFEARGAIAAVLGQIWRWVLPGVRRVDAGEAVRGRCLRDGCQHPSRVRGVHESRGSRLGLVLLCLARAAAAAGSPQLLGTSRRWDMSVGWRRAAGSAESHGFCCLYAARTALKLPRGRWWPWAATQALCGLDGNAMCVRTRSA